MKKMPLRYNISRWDDLVSCLSNTSNSLRIRVRKIMQDTRLEGTAIEIVHSDFGTLFCYLVDANGPILDSEDPLEYELPTSRILKELERFGFYVTFDKRANLPDNQIEYLKTVQKLGFDKIRVLNVYTYNNQGFKKTEPMIVVFNVESNPGWLDNAYSAGEFEFVESLKAGTAINLSDMSETLKFRWDWLDYVANIQDILDDNEPSEVVE